MSRKLKNVIYKMLTENTGCSFLDSGGDDGRHWQRNSKKTLKDFEAEPKAVLELTKHDRGVWVDVTISVFHFLAEQLELDDICNKFNSKKVRNWDSEAFYGVSDTGEQFLLTHFDGDSDTFNTYNDDSKLSQCLQGCYLVHKATGERYILLQIHNGADVRGGYTNAKLFKVPGEYIYEHAYFATIDYMGRGEFITEDGSLAEHKDFERLFYADNKHETGTVFYEGSI